MDFIDIKSFTCKKEQSRIKIKKNCCVSGGHLV